MSTGNHNFYPERPTEAHIDFAGVRTERDVHELFARSLAFPDYYGCNWDAFWDVLMHEDCFPRRLILSGTQHLRSSMPKVYAQLQSCFADHHRESPNLAPEVIWS